MLPEICGDVAGSLPNQRKLHMHAGPGPPNDQGSPAYISALLFRFAGCLVQHQWRSSMHLLNCSFIQASPAHVRLCAVLRSRASLLVETLEQDENTDLIAIRDDMLPKKVFDNLSDPRISLSTQCRSRCKQQSG